MGLAAPAQVAGAVVLPMVLPEGLTCRAQFLQVQRRGRRQHGRLLTLLVLSSAGLPPRVGLTVSRRVGNAVVRNRVRRRLREIVRAQAPAWPPGVDHVVVAHPAAAAAPFAALGDEMAMLLRRAQPRPSRPRQPPPPGRRG